MGNTSSKPAKFVWRDRNVYNSFNESIFYDGEEDIFCVTTSSAAISLIRQYRDSHTVFLITNGGDNSRAFIDKVRNELNLQTEIVVFCNAVDYHKTWASKYSNVSVFSGKQKLKQWVDNKRRSYNNNINNNDDDEKKTDNYTPIQRIPDFYTRANNGNYDTYSKNSFHYVNQYGLKENLFKISNKSDLKLDYKIKAKAIRDSSGYGKIPITPRPVLTIKLNISYSQWTESYQNTFLENLAKELIVKPSQLTLIASSRGSINASVIINAVQTQYGGRPITCAYIEGKRQTLKYSANMKKYRIESTKIESWFNEAEKNLDKKTATQELNRSTFYHLPNSLTKTEKWIIHQTKSLRISLQTALAKTREEFIVDAICILDNDTALNQFIKHPNMDKAKLLFHGPEKTSKVLGGIFREGLRHGGGSVYGHGSYLTSSPLHAIHYQIFMKGYSKSSQTFTLIAAYVNCGKIKQIYDKSFAGKNIQYPYDSHYIARVGSSTEGHIIGYPYTTGNVYGPYTTYGYNGEIADEYAIDDKTRILPRFYITLRRNKCKAVVVWRDKNIFTPRKESLVDALVQNKLSVYPARTSSEAMKIINVKKHENILKVVTSPTDYAESFVKQVIQATNKKKDEIYVFTDKDEKWNLLMGLNSNKKRNEGAEWVDKYDNVHVIRTGAQLVCVLMLWALLLAGQMAAAVTN